MTHRHKTKIMVQNKLLPDTCSSSMKTQGFYFFFHTQPITHFVSIVPMTYLVIYGWMGVVWYANL